MRQYTEILKHTETDFIHH